MPLGLQITSLGGSSLLGALSAVTGRRPPPCEAPAPVQTRTSRRATLAAPLVLLPAGAAAAAPGAPAQPGAAAPGPAAFARRQLLSLLSISSDYNRCALGVPAACALCSAVQHAAMRVLGIQRAAAAAPAPPHNTRLLGAPICV